MLNASVDYLWFSVCCGCGLVVNLRVWFCLIVWFVWFGGLIL